MQLETEETVEKHDPYAVLRIRDFRLFWAGNFLGVFGMQVQTVAVGWEIFERTDSNLNLGLVGLVQFLPILALAPFTGHLADRMDRKKIVMTALLVIMLSALGLAWISAWEGPPWLIYACLFVTGVARAFQQPARASLLPQIVPVEQFSNAVAWNVGGFHLATLLGPVVGGALIEFWGGAALDYLIYACAVVGYLFFLARIHTPPFVSQASESWVHSFAAGCLHLRTNQIILGAITLDLLAVLLGGATALLPAYAKKILEVGPTALGCMQAAPAMGAFVMSILLAHRAPVARAGRALLAGVAGFGVAIIVFGLSRSFWLSLLMLLLTGAFDNVSVVIRHTLVQVLTPNELRGRVSAVNGLFIGASNELGGFESGLVAHFFGPTISVVSGGIGTLLVVALVSTCWPQLRRYGRLGSNAQY